MTKSGWDIAMRRIDNEFDIPQFVASSLVRKIAANNFRLPTADRAKFQRLPDEVIARIEHIVRDAYLEAGEDVGGEILREHLWQQALDARRAMIANGELISEDLFCERLGIAQRRLGKLLADGSVFSMVVDDVTYYPAMLADAELDRKRFQAICRILVPAPAGCRLHFLSSSRGSLGGRSPVEMLDNDDDFKRLRQAAAAWAAEYSRTAVRLFEGTHETEPANVEPMYEAAAEIDPRRPVLERALTALEVHGYQWPLGPYPDARNFTAFVAHQNADDTEPRPDACVQIVTDGELIRIRIIFKEGIERYSETVPVGTSGSAVDVAKKVVTYLLRRYRRFSQHASSRHAATDEFPSRRRQRCIRDARNH